ncbi:MAG: putative toxin-antitoxin system toxin component, PIN family [Gammaproteobacteria bacterium]
MRVVCDTNVVVSAILFQRGKLSTLRDAWTRGRITPLVNKPCMEELLRVLTYPKFRLSAREIESLLSSYLPYTETIATDAVKTIRLARCRDADDQKFLVLAYRGKAQALVTGDKALLALKHEVSFDILPPADLLQRMR